MQSGGGFIIDDLSTVFDYDDPNNRPTALPRQPTHENDDDNDSHPRDTVATPKPLTSKQEAKLRSYLDGALEDITRGYRKRFDPSSSLHTLTSYLGEWMRLLGVLAHVPPYGSGSTNLLVSYMLRCSTELSDGITGYSLAMETEAMRRQRKRQKQDRVNETDTGRDDEEEEESDDEEEERQHQIASRTKQLNLGLQTLDLVDRIWAAVLRGNLINLHVALTNAKKAFPDTTETVSADDQPPSHKSHIPRVVHSTTSLVPSPAIDGRFRSSDATSSTTSEPRESLPIHGGRANKTVGVTDQVRLRNIAISSRDKLFSWMRAELDAPAPPTMQDEADEADEPRDNTVEGALGVRQGNDTVAGGTVEEEEEEEEEEFEDVAIGAEQLDDSKGYNGEQDTEERRHYQDLFDRKLDPDADDDDDGDVPSAVQTTDQQNNESTQTLGASVLGTVEAVTSSDSNDKRKRSTSPSQTSSPRPDGLPSKRRRRSASPDTPTEAGGELDGKMSRSEMGSLNFTLSDFGQWDVAFTRLFSKTLRTLSDLGEFSHRTARKEFSTSLAGISGADEQEASDDRA